MKPNRNCLVEKNHCLHVNNVSLHSKPKEQPLNRNCLVGLANHRKIIVCMLIMLACPADRLSVTYLHYMIRGRSISSDTTGNDWLCRWVGGKVYKIQQETVTTHKSAKQEVSHWNVEELKTTRSNYDLWRGHRLWTETCSTQKHEWLTFVHISRQVTSGNPL